MRSRNTREQGFALAIAIVAIVIIGVLIAGAFFMSMQDQRVGANALVQQRAFAVAEAGLNRGVADFISLSLDTLQNGRTRRDGPFNVGSGRDVGRYVLRTTRLNDRTFWMVAEGVADADRPTATTRSTNMVLRGLQMAIRADGAIVAAGSVQVYDSGEVDGNGNVPPGWGGSCSIYTNPGAPAVLAPASATVTVSGGGQIVGGVGRSPVAADTLTYTNFGDPYLSNLIANANVTGVSGSIVPAPASLVQGGLTVCDRSVSSNWGDPQRSSPAQPCERYFPVIHAPGDLLVTNGRGQGMLLVDGDLTLSGNFNFNGVVIVRGRLDMSDDAEVRGTVLARGSGSTSLRAGGTSDIHYSRCAILSALRAVSQPTPAKHRAWADLF